MKLFSGNLYKMQKIPNIFGIFFVKFLTGMPAIKIQFFLVFVEFETMPISLQFLRACPCAIL